MSETVDVGPATDEDVRVVLRRRNAGDVTLRIALDLAERGLAWAARDQSETIGLALAVDADTQRHVGELFVEPSYRSQGIGARLLDAAFEDAGDRDRSMALPPGDAAALALALRRGLAPNAELVRLSGPMPREEHLFAMAVGEYRFDVSPIDPERHAYALDALDRETRGNARKGAHARFTRDSDGTAFFLSGELVAYAYCWPDGRVGPVAAASPAYLVQIFAFALATLQRSFGASWCTALVPGSNVRIARAALRGGLRIVERTLIASDGIRQGLERYVAYENLCP